MVYGIWYTVVYHIPVYGIYTTIPYTYKNHKTPKTPKTKKPNHPSIESRGIGDGNKRDKV